MPVVVAALARSPSVRRPTDYTKIKPSKLDALEGLPEESERLGEGYVDKKVLQKDGSSRWVRVYASMALYSFILHPQMFRVTVTPCRAVEIK